MNNREWLELLSNEQINEIIDRDILEAQTIPCNKMPVIIYVTEVITAYRTFTGEDLSSELSDEQLAKALAEPCCDFCVKGLTDNDKKSIVDEATNLFMEWLGTEHNSVSSNIMNWLTEHLGTEVDAGQYWNWVWLGYNWPVLKDYEPDWAYMEQLEEYEKRRNDMITTNITEAVRGEFKKKGMQNYDLIKAVKDENGDMRALAREVYQSEADTMYANGSYVVFKYLPEGKYGVLNYARYDLTKEKAEQLLEYGF